MHTPRSEYASFTKGLVVGFWGLSCPFSWDKQGAEGLGVGVVAKLLAGFFSFLLSPFHSFHHNIDNTKLHSGIPLPSEKIGCFWEKGNGKVLPAPKRWQTALPISQNENPCLFPFVALTDRIDSPASSANYIPAVYCKSNGKITIDIGTLPIFTLASFMMLCPSWIYP